MLLFCFVLFLKIISRGIVKQSNRYTNTQTTNDLQKNINTLVNVYAVEIREEEEEKMQHGGLDSVEKCKFIEMMAWLELSVLAKIRFHIECFQWLGVYVC